MMTTDYKTGESVRGATATATERAGPATVEYFALEPPAVEPVRGTAEAKSEAKAAANRAVLKTATGAA